MSVACVMYCGRAAAFQGQSDCQLESNMCVASWCLIHVM
jgi:hypothetical protein